jgi:hypothetical protein
VDLWDPLSTDRDRGGLNAERLLAPLETPRVLKIMIEVGVFVQIMVLVKHLKVRLQLTRDSGE